MHKHRKKYTKKENPLKPVSSQSCPEGSMQIHQQCLEDLSTLNLCISTRVAVMRLPCYTNVGEEQSSLTSRQFVLDLFLDYFIILLLYDIGTL